ncbi:MAG: hypothetical protein ACREQV_17685, partial [Candidatus Binatia bacterium]
MARLWLVLTSVVVTYAIVDIVAGFLLIRPISPLTVPDLYMHHKLQPDTYSQIITPDYEYTQRANNVGLRGHDINIQKDPEHYRVVMLGDSFTMGQGVKDEETFSALLEEALQAKHVRFGGKEVEIVNAGVDSY